MECSEDIACQLLDWFTSNGVVVKQALHAIDRLWDAAGGHITTFLADHGEKLVAAASFCFAIWRWLVYRERVLYKWLEE